MNPIVRTTLKATMTVLGVASGAYAGYAGVTWLRYGAGEGLRHEEVDPLLDRFMPVYDVAERAWLDYFVHGWLSRRPVLAQAAE